MALQTVSSSTASAESYLNTLSEEEREQVELALLLNQSDSSQSSPNLGLSSSKLTHKTQPSASNVEVVTLSSSDSEDDNGAPSTSGITEPVNETPPVAGPSNKTRKMICHRCPTEKIGTFTNEEKYRIHIKRHLYGDVFQCATCHRPFTKINFCISHEIRVHGSKINYNNRDGVIAYAKRYVEERAAKRARGPTPSTSTNRNLVDEETDDEDPKFYNNPIVASTGLTKYRGPPVNSLLEAYEIQVTYSRDRSKNACDIAQKALDTHLENVENKFDTYKLKQCPFSKKTKGAATKRKRPARRS